jgi:hypothetical protein
MTTFLNTIRSQLYFTFLVWDDLFMCFEHYAHSELHGRNEVELMGVSKAGWDFTAMKKESDVEALMKIIRFIANLFTEAEIGQHIYREHSTQYKELIRTLKDLLQRKSDLEKYDVPISQFSNSLHAH